MRYMNIIRKMKQLIDSVRHRRGQGGCGAAHFVSYGGDAYFRDWHAESKYSTGLLLQKVRARYRRDPLARRRLHPPHQRLRQPERL